MIADTLDRVLRDVLTAPARGGEFKRERWLARLPPEDRELVEPLLAVQDDRPPLPDAPSDRVRRLALWVADTYNQRVRLVCSANGGARCGGGAR